MLGKLMKTEIKATARTYLPLFAVLLAFTAINKIFWSINASGLMIGLPRGLAVTGYVLTMGAIAAMALIVTVQRFRKNLLGDEGYLMFTLPVKTWQLTLSKLLPAIMWQFLSIVLAALTIFILAYDPSWKIIPAEIADLLHRFSQGMGVNFFVFLLEVLLFAFASASIGVLIIYASIALGHLFNSHRTLWAFVAFIAINIVLQTVLTLVLQAVGNFFDWSWFHFTVKSAIHTGLLGGAAGMLALSVGFFAGTNAILSKRLNLE